MSKQNERCERLKEDARLKAPVDDAKVKRVVEYLRKYSYVLDTHFPQNDTSDTAEEAADLIERLAAKVEELFEQVAALTEERDWYSTANERAERAEAAIRGK